MTTILPRLFIGSSSEGLPMARGLQNNLRVDHDVTIWDQDVFRLSKSTLGNLVDALRKFDFAIFVFSPVDDVTLRGDTFVTARDNVHFECGLFMGCLGRARTFFVRPTDVPNLRIPSDLLGITAGTYKSTREDQNWTAELAPAAGEISRQIHHIWIEKGYYLSRYVPMAVSRPDSPESWFKLVMQSGCYCGIDEVFWLGYCERLQPCEPCHYAERAAMIAAARDSLKATILPRDVYALMQVLFDRVVKRRQLYLAIATEVDLMETQDEFDSEKFLFQSPKACPDRVWRLFLLPKLDVLKALNPSLKSDLAEQLSRGTELRILRKKPAEDDNFGVYGDLAVGTLDPVTRRNVVNFHQTAVRQRQSDFFALWDCAVRLTPDMLGS